MAHPIVHADMNSSSVTHASVRPDRSERRLRQGSAWVMLYFLLQAELGLAWDRQWHDLVGRDQFWIPPHILMYSGLGGAGLVALWMVLADTVRYLRRVPGVDDSSTFGVLGVFHAPLGFIMLGFGALTDLAAAPLDNYWHELYGIDVTLWSPFHIMGTIGGILAGLGAIYAFASEAALERQTEHPSRHFLGLNGPEWGTLILLSAFMELPLPALTAFSPIAFGSLNLLTYPLILACAGGFALIAAVRFTGKPGTATLTALLLWLEAVITQSFVPWTLLYTVPRFGLTFRFTGREPAFNVTLALLPLLFLTGASLIDGVALWQRQHRKTLSSGLRGAWSLGILIALPAAVLPSWIVLVLMHLPPVFSLPPDVLKVLAPHWLDTLLTFPLTLIIGTITAMVGASLGDIWHWNRR